MGEDRCAMQIIDPDGEFKDAGLDSFVEEVKLGGCGVSYIVTSIIGPQSSGKSTLMNHLFGTRFTEMDISKRRSQTTKGIWIAKCVDIEPCTLAMDVEGTDGRERGEDDTTFERQSALFALAISDIVLINMWCHDIGREHAANKPLLRTIFEVMMRLFDPSRKTTLMFVIRDKSKSSLEILELDLMEEIQKIWNAVPKPRDHESTLLDDYFKVEVVALSSYEDKEEKFQEEVAQLRQRFINSTSPGWLAAGDRKGALPASEFSRSAQEMWKQIKENKDLDLPSHKKMIATIRCEEIANEKFKQLSSDEDWLALDKAVLIDRVKDFGGRLSSILNTYVSGYDRETEYFDEVVRNSKRHDLLEKKASDLVRPAYKRMLKYLRSEALEYFKMRLEKSLKTGEGFASSVIAHTESCLCEFDQGCAGASINVAIISNLNNSEVQKKKKLEHDIKVYASSERDKRLSKLKLECEGRLLYVLSTEDPLVGLLEGNDDIWATKRKLLKDALEVEVLHFSNEINDYALDQERSAEMLQNLRDYARNAAEKKPRQEAPSVVMHMANRFFQAFYLDSNFKPRTWSAEDDIEAMTRDAHSAALKILATLAAIRLDERIDNIEQVLFSSLMDGEINSTTLLADTWDAVSSKDTLITPEQCGSYWRQFKEQTNHIVKLARAKQEAHAQNNVNNKLKIVLTVAIVALLASYGVPKAEILGPLILRYAKALGTLEPLILRTSRTVGSLGGLIVALRKIVETYRQMQDFQEMRH